MNTKPLFADTKPTKKYLVDGITKDITIEDAIFDLIDNSIDAFQGNKNGFIPENYHGYKIELILKDDYFSIIDSGTGIDTKILQTNALRFGSHPKHHDTSIGHFGIGLNRALFKLGKIAVISTSTKNEKSQLTFDSNKFISDDNYWDLPLTTNKLDTSLHTGTFISIEILNKEVSEKFSSSEWLEGFTLSISQRYALFLSKNLVISINNKDITSTPIKISESSAFKKLTSSFKDNSIEINIQLGQHSDFLFQYEQTADRKNQITRKECGWFVYCNGRAIKLFDWSTDTGWFPKPHSEHNGFVGIAEFVGDPSKLPWNTSKSNIDLNNETYKKALTVMKDFSEKWRTHTGKIKRGQLLYPSSEVIDNDKTNQFTLQDTQNFNQDTSSKSQSKNLEFYELFENDCNQDESDIKNNVEVSEPIQNLVQNTSIQVNNKPSELDKNFDQDLFIKDDNLELSKPQNFDQEPSINKDNIEVPDSTNNSSQDETLKFEYDPNFTAPPHALEHDYLFGSPKSKVPFNIPDHEYKIRSILNELIKIKIEAKNGFPLASIMLIRCFIELGCTYYLKKKGINPKNKKGSLGEQVKYCLDKMTELKFTQDLDSRRISTMYSLCNENKSEKNVLCLQNLQITIHSDDLIWNKSQILAFWYGILPFLIECYA